MQPCCVGGYLTLALSAYIFASGITIIDQYSHNLTPALAANMTRHPSRGRQQCPSHDLMTIVAHRRSRLWDLRTLGFYFNAVYSSLVSVSNNPEDQQHLLIRHITSIDLFSIP